MDAGRRRVYRGVCIALLIGLGVGCGTGIQKADPGVILRASVASDGSEGLFLSLEPAISDDGRFVAFRSGSDNLVFGDTNGADDVFLRDTCLGVSACTPSTIRVSVANDGSQVMGHSLAPSISGDGRFVAFGSESDNLVPNDTNGFSDIFVRDTCAGATGCTPSTTLVSVAGDGTQGNSFVGWYASISADGRYVAFTSFADNLVPGDTNGNGDIFVRDTCLRDAGCVPSTVRVSIAGDGSELASGSTGPSISADGRFVTFSTFADGVTADDTDGVPGIFQRDTCAGASGCTPSTVLIGPASSRSNIIWFFRPEMSANGRYVVFMSDHPGIVPEDTNNNLDVFVRDTCRSASQCGPSTTRISVGSAGGQGSGGSGGPTISADGRLVAFSSMSSDLVDGDFNGQDDVFVRDTCAGVANCSPRTYRVSVNSAGEEGDNRSFRPALSGDGRFLTLRSTATNLVLDDRNFESDIFVAVTGK